MIKKCEVNDFGKDCFGFQREWLFISSEDFEYKFSSIDELKEDHPEVLDMEISNRFKMFLELDQHYNVDESNNKYYGNNSKFTIYVK